MAFTPLHLQNLTELKTRVGNATDTVIATILGLNYPTTEGFSVYVWNNTSLQVGDDNEVVVPNPRVGQAGRWMKIDLLALQFETDPTVASYIKAITEANIAYWNSKYDGNNPLNFISTETDPTVPNVVKGITLADITNWNSKQTALGYTPYNSTNPAGYISSETDPTVPSAVKAISLGDINNWNNKLSVVPPQSFTSLTGKPTTVAGYGITDALTSINSTQVSTALGYTPINPNSTNLQYIAGDGSKITFPSIPTSTTQITEGTNLYFTTARGRASISLTTIGISGAASYNNATGVLNIPNYSTSTPVYTNTAVKTINGVGVQISTTKNTRVSYSITHTIALTLLVSTGSSMVYLEISTDNTNWTIINQAGYSESLAVAVVVNKSITNNIQGEVPAGSYVRLRAVTSGGGTATYTSGQEVQY